jgi:hypothetical protein
MLYICGLRPPSLGLGSSVFFCTSMTIPTGRLNKNIVSKDLFID